MKEKNIILPWHVRRGIRKRSASFPAEYRLFAGDCETFEGAPLSIQLTDNADDADLLWVDQKTVLPTFMKWIGPRLLRHRVNVCFFHNLSFDLTVLLYDHLAQLDSSCVTLSLHGTKWEILSGKIYYAKVKYKDGTVLHIIDSFRFYVTSLAKLGETLQTKTRKGEKPARLGHVKFTQKDEQFVRYAKEDAMLGFEVGEHILKMHKEFDVALSISAPQFAMRVFTKYHLQEGESISLPGKAICRGALASYHGGKNGFYVKPGLYRNVTELDISSAYPHAMKSLPQFVRGTYRMTTAYDPRFQGVYCVTGSLRLCRYAIFQSHDGKALHGGRVEKLWVTSYELAEALRDGEFVLESCTGWLWLPDPSHDHNPLAEFVDVFYAKKEASHKGDPNYLTYKLLLNSLYGKFIQNVEVEEHGKVNGELIVEDGRASEVAKRFKAGGLFNPVIATLITGFVRAYLHRLEHQYQAVHSSTDSIKTLAVVERDALPRGLGGLNVEVAGDCVLLRNKLYLHYAGPMVAGGKPAKFALHGFWGSVDDLLGMVAGRSIHYAVTHLYRMKEAKVQGRVALKSYVQEREVYIDWQNYIEFPGVAAEGAGSQSGSYPLQEEIWIPAESLGRDGGSRAQAARRRPASRSVLETVFRRIQRAGGIRITADAAGEFRRYGLREGYGSLAALFRGRKHPHYASAMDWSQWTDTFIGEGALSAGAGIDDLFDLILKNRTPDSDDMIAMQGQRWEEKQDRLALDG